MADTLWGLAKINNMMKKIILIAVLAMALCPRSARAVMTEMPLSTSTVCVPITVSNTAPTAMESVIDSTTSVSIQTILSIQNQDATHAIYCSGSGQVGTSGNYLGWEIANSTSSYDFTLRGYQQWYCLAATAAVQTVVCKMH